MSSAPAAGGENGSAIGASAEGAGTSPRGAAFRSPDSGAGAAAGQPWRCGGPPGVALAETKPAALSCFTLPARSWRPGAAQPPSAATREACAVRAAVLIAARIAMGDTISALQSGYSPTF